MGHPAIRDRGRSRRRDLDVRLGSGGPLGADDRPADDLAVHGRPGLRRVRHEGRPTGWRLAVHGPVDPLVRRASVRRRDRGAGRCLRPVRGPRRVDLGRDRSRDAPLGRESLGRDLWRGRHPERLPGGGRSGRHRLDGQPGPGGRHGRPLRRRQRAVDHPAPGRVEPELGECVDRRSRRGCVDLRRHADPALRWRVGTGRGRRPGPQHGLDAVGRSRSGRSGRRP